MFGSQMASHGGMTPVYTNIWLKRMKRIYEKLSAIPVARFHPIPPRFFLEERDTPMIVNMKAENGRENLVCFSINEYFTLGSPLSFCVSISASNSS